MVSKAQGFMSIFSVLISIKATRGPSPVNATEQLKNNNLQTWNAVINHQFCAELAAGTLPESKMGWYLVQDYKFIDNFVRLLATAIAHAPTINDSVPAAQFLALVTSTENTYFQRSFVALGISKARQDAPPAPETSAFQNLMEEARKSGRYEQMLAVLVVAEWTYLSWAEQYTQYSDDLPFWFSEWIDLHSGEGFESVVSYLRDQLDKTWETLAQDEKDAASEMFKKAVQFELDFFNAAYSA